MILIEVSNKYTRDQEIALMKAVNSALLESFKVTLDAINIRLIVHEPHRFSVPAYCSAERYVLISIDCFSGRSTEAKRDLYRTIVNNINELEIPKDHVKIVLRESIKENWGILGGFAGSDVDVGYKVEI